MYFKIFAVWKKYCKYIIVRICCFCLLFILWMNCLRWRVEAVSNCNNFIYNCKCSCMNLLSCCMFFWKYFLKHATTVVFDGKSTNKSELCKRLQNIYIVLTTFFNLVSIGQNYLMVYPDKLLVLMKEKLNGKLSMIYSSKAPCCTNKNSAVLWLPVQ